MPEKRHSGYILKFISGKYQGGEFPMLVNSSVKIGRSSDLDMVLVEDMVSRRHAMISVYDGDIWIEDIGSTNGTFVNGEKVQKQRLKEGDRILVGTSIIKLLYQDPSQEEVDGDAAGAFGTQPDPAAEASPARPNPGHTQAITTTSVLTGYLEEVPLPDLLQLFAAGKKNGCLIINTETHEGKIFLKKGRLHAATINDDLEVPMNKAFYRMMGWNTGTFMLDTSIEADFDSELDENIESMMMEGMRLLDEVRNIGADLPDLAEHMHLPVPLVPPLRNLTPELLDTLQLVHNYGRVETVLNKSLASDLETLQDIVYLMRNEYLRLD